MIYERAAKAFCSEDPALIENYSAAAADNTQTWDIHHRAEILPCGNYSAATLKKHQLYYHRPASELIFLKHGEHMRFHALGRSFSAETRKKMSRAKIGNKHALGTKLSAETRKKISLANIGKKHTAATKKKMSLAMSGEKNPAFGKHWTFGYRWYTSGAKNVFAKTCPPGFAPGRCLRRS